MMAVMFMQPISDPIWPVNFADILERVELMKIDYFASDQKLCNKIKFAGAFYEV